MKIMFICTGNTCRSPMAEAIFASEAEKFELRDLSFSSAGLAVFQSEKTSENTAKVLSEMGIKLISEYSKPLMQSDLLDTDIFFVMTQSHKNALLRYVDESKIYLPKREIPDPYGGDMATYRKCAEVLLKETRSFIRGLFEIKLERLSDENLEYAAKIEAECFSKPWSTEALREEIQNEAARFFVLFFAGKAAGYGGMHCVCGEAYIDNIAVLEKYRGYGFGEYITSFLIETAKKENCEFISLEVRQSNTPAKKLYEKLLFKKAGTRKGFYSEPLEDADIYTYYFKGEQNENTWN